MSPVTYRVVLHNVQTVGHVTDVDNRLLAWAIICISNNDDLECLYTLEDA